MARNHAHILTAIWSDPDWTALSQRAQHTYLLLLSQPKLTLVGLLDLLPSRWARLAADTSLASVEAAIDELEASRFVLVDHDTAELLVRSLVRHDATPSKVANPRWLTGMWSAWQAIQSRQLRAAVAAEIPPSVWDSHKVTPPAEAEPHNPRSAQKLPLEAPARNNGQNVPQSPVTSHQSYAVADLKQPANSRAAPPGPAAAVDNSDRDVFDEALDLLVAAELDRNPTRNGNPERHAQAVQRGKRRDHVAAARQALAANPGLTAAELAAVLEPPARPRPAASDPLAGQQAAARARAERHARAAAGEACQACGDTGWTLDEDGAAIPCHHTHQEAS